MSESPLKVLMTIQTMEQPAGGSLYVRDFCLELFRHGHSPVVYCRRPGIVSDELLDFGIPIVDSIDALLEPDVIHGNAPIETVAAILRFPRTPAIFVCHGWRSPDAIPPKMPSILRYLTVSELTEDGLLYFGGVRSDRITRHMNPVDLHRFARRDPLPTQPRKAVILSNWISDANHAPAIRDACSARGMSVDIIGLESGTSRLDPENILGQYDVVFAKGRSALEAAATGCAVVLCDTRLGEMITTENYDALRRRNFGIRTFQFPVDGEHILEQLKRYDPADASAVTERVREREGLAAATMALVDIYQSAIADFGNCATVDDADYHLATARFLDNIAPSANTFFVAQQSATVANRARVAEAKLLALRETLTMRLLETRYVRLTKIRLLHAPRTWEAASRREVVVSIENGGDEVLSSIGDHPVHLSYHWLTRDGLTVCFDGLRSDLFPPLPPNRTSEYRLKVDGPNATGDLILRVTLVQEGVRWFDECGVMCDARCAVAAPLQDVPD